VPAPVTSETKQKYPVSVAAYLKKNRDTSFKHSVFVIEAVSRDEAEGKALAIARKIYPASAGWQQHHAAIGEMDVCTLDNARPAD
jgi:hypothetical protein